jgi:hypothetical protein
MQSTRRFSKPPVHRFWPVQLLTRSSNQTRPLHLRFPVRPVRPAGPVFKTLLLPHSAYVRSVGIRTGFRYSPSALYLLRNQNFIYNFFSYLHVFFNLDMITLVHTLRKVLHRISKPAKKAYIPSKKRQKFDFCKGKQILLELQWRIIVSFKFMYILISSWYT